MRNLVALIVFGLLLSFGFSAYAQPPDQSPQPAQDVTVVNPDTEPIPTFDVDNPSFQPVHLSCQIVLNDTIFSVTEPCTDQTVPTGKRFVIEHVSWTPGFPHQTQFPSVSLELESFNLDDGELSSHFYLIAFDQQANDAFGNATYGASEHVKLYHNSGNINVIFSRFGNNADQAFLNVSISGYLVDVN